ncbi:hypothetical protein T440DRAFT_62256 [Plenodomus tracheiphilus IPT5]|uniref:Uncharacterized protein n=1 Tax=Plenodomus tracheiphilus IPT5 TaxID=1408161 RepID=A0A6A7BAL5_9PLEO|nr:hypothetical protein T440DRAFT_62256 [Plenodomus tracheiphilus IPT5]
MVTARRGRGNRRPSQWRGFRRNSDTLSSFTAVARVGQEKNNGETDPTWNHSIREESFAYLKSLAFILALLVLELVCACLTPVESLCRKHLLVQRAPLIARDPISSALTFRHIAWPLSHLKLPTHVSQRKSRTQNGL